MTALAALLASATTDAGKIADKAAKEGRGIFGMFWGWVTEHWILSVILGFVLTFAIVAKLFIGKMNRT